MFKFESNGGAALTYCSLPIMNDITAWVNPNVWLMHYGNEEGRLTLNVAELREDEVLFRDEEGLAELRLSLTQKKGAFSLSLTGAYRPKVGHGTHLDETKSLGLRFSFPHDGNYIDCFMNCRYWQRPFISDDNRALKPRTQALFYRKEANITYLLTTAHKDFKTELFSNGDFTDLTAHANAIKDSIHEKILVGSCGENAYTLPEAAAEYGLKVMEKPGMLRKKKKMPPVFESLGWCSWDAFHMDVTHRNLIDKAQEFRDKGIPVKWMIMDDMWGDVPAIDRETMHSRELNSFEAAPERFPQGLAGVIGELKEKYDMKVGMWHPITGYWHGIDPNGTLASEHRDLLAYTIPRFAEDGSRLMHSFEPAKAEKYYDLQHRFYKNCGAEFVKVDNQGSTEYLSYHQGTIGESAETLHGAIEKSVKHHFGGAIINCMGMPIENFWNRTYSAVCRFSGDFMPEDRKWFIQHLLQCSYNALTQGAVYIGDWDMWWSDDAQARKNAVLRAMSGGPIYMSDELGRSVREVILPLAFSDGTILRLPEPAIPCRDCLFENAEKDGKLYKVFNQTNDVGMVAAFNLSEDERPVSGEIAVTDVEGLKDGRYIAYDWFGGKAVVLEKGEKLPLTLENYDDFRLYILAPIKSGKALLGLAEKYIMPLTYRKKLLKYAAKDEGDMLIWSEKPLAGFEDCGGGIWKKKVTKDEEFTF